jgi:hypothetical protein
MPSPQENCCQPDYRAEALLCAIRTCASGASDLLARHPLGDLLRNKSADGEGPPLAKLLWQELIDEEKGCLGARGSYYVDQAEGKPLQYWQRRVRLAGWVRRREATASLPQPWPCILDLPSPSARQLCVVIGTEMVTRACATQPLPKVAAKIGALGADLAGQIVERLRRSKVSPPSEAIASRWMDAYQRMAREVAGDRIVSALGRSLLATLFRRLPPESQKAAIDVSRSKLTEMLATDMFLEPIGPEELALAQKLSQALLPRGFDRVEPRQPQGVR